MFASCCRVRTNFAALRSKIYFLWAMWFHVADFSKEIYISRLKCSNEIDWNWCFISFDHSNRDFSSCCRVNIDLAESCNKCCFLWTTSSRVADFLKQIYILRLKCSNEVDRDLICLIIIYLFHHHLSVSFICLIHLPHSSVLTNHRKCSIQRQRRRKRVIHCWSINQHEHYFFIASISQHEMKFQFIFAIHAFWYCKWILLRSMNKTDRWNR